MTPNTDPPGVEELAQKTRDRAKVSTDPMMAMYGNQCASALESLRAELERVREALLKDDALALRSHDALSEVRDFLRDRHPGTDLYEVVTSALYDIRARTALNREG